MLMTQEFISITKRCVLLNHAPVTAEEIGNSEETRGEDGAGASQIFGVVV